MENILLLNLKRNGDILSTGHIISSLKKEYPQANIFLLVYSEFRGAATCLKDVSQIFTIDRKKIVTFKKNRLFSDAFFINCFYETLQRVKEFKWDLVVNLSNNKLSSLLVSYLDGLNFVGTKIDENGLLAYSNIWSSLFNEVLTNYPYTPFHFIDIYHKMLEIPYFAEEIKLKLDPEHNKKAHENLTDLRVKLSNRGRDVKLLAIQLKSSDNKKDLPLLVLIDLIREIIGDPGLHPILITSSFKDEKMLVNEINKHFNNSLLSVEADLKALPSILVNVDLLITPDTAIKHIADLVSTPTIEISLGTAPLHKQGSLSSQNLILTPSIVQDKNGLKEAVSSCLKAKDIIQMISCFFNRHSLSDIRLSPNLTLYQCVKDTSGHSYRPIKGKIDHYFEISTLLSRYYIFYLFDDIHQEEIISCVFKMFDKNKIIDWIEYQKEHIIILVRHLLDTLRSSRTFKGKSTDENSKRLVVSLDKLLECCEFKSLVAIPSLLFRGEMEKIISKNVNENIREMEKLLYTFKGQVQALTSILSQLSTFDQKEIKASNDNINFALEKP